jgi:opacity protein-like surface antigen
MSKLFHTAAAAAALLALSMAANAAEVGARPPVYAPPPIYLAPPFSWTGFYLGANIGEAWGRRNVTDSLFGLSLSNSVNNNGAFIGGGQLGFNYQFGNFVLGIEGDFDGIANTNTAANGVVGPGIAISREKSPGTFAAGCPRHPAASDQLRPLDRLWSLEAIKAAAVMFRVHRIKQSVLFSGEMHADLHLAWSFHFRRRQGHAG